jgi:hypothetical protein
MTGLRRLWQTVLRFLYEITIGWIAALLRLAVELGARAAARRDLNRRGEAYTHCQVIPPDVYKRPDPLIYSQFELMQMGLAVTWDNPDIQLYDVAGGMAPVPSGTLRPETEYEIRATIYNGSTEAPAPGLPVDFSYLSFGIGATSTPIGTTSVNLPVRGAAGHPATAAVRWRTPSTGHYCIQVKLIWADDANPNNNLGQENTNVGTAHSPARFLFPVGNQNRVAATLELQADMYAIPSLPGCDEDAEPDGTAAKAHGERPRERSRRDREEADRRECERRLRRHRRESHGVGEGWSVTIAPPRLTLQPGEEREVEVVVEPPSGFAGTRPVNVSATDEHGRLVGGVTLRVEGSGS